MTVLGWRDQVGVWVATEFIVLDFTSQDHAGEFDFDYDAEAMLSAIVGVRAELAAGDLRPLYLAWLAAYGDWERDEDVFDCDADDSAPKTRRAGNGCASWSRTTIGRVGAR